MLDVVRGEGISYGREFPLGMPLDSDALGVIKSTLQ